MKKGFVFINGYGLVKFRSLNKNVFTSEDGHESTQYQGLIKLPKGVIRCDGEKWIDIDYWFSDEQIFETKCEAIEYLR